MFRNQKGQQFKWVKNVIKKFLKGKMRDLLLTPKQTINLYYVERKK